MPTNDSGIRARSGSPALGASALYRWLPPLVSTVLTLPLGLWVFAIGVLAPVACDVCTDADRDRFEASYDIAWPVLNCGLLAAALVLVLAWLPPWWRPRTPSRTLLAVLAPVLVVLSAVVFQAVVDLPD